MGTLNILREHLAADTLAADVPHLKLDCIITSQYNTLLEKVAADGL